MGDAVGLGFAYRYKSMESMQAGANIKAKIGSVLWVSPVIHTTTYSNPAMAKSQEILRWAFAVLWGKSCLGKKFAVTTKIKPNAIPTNRVIEWPSIRPLLTPNDTIPAVITIMDAIQIAWVVAEDLLGLQLMSFFR